MGKKLKQAVPTTATPFVPPYVHYVAERIAETTGIKPTLEKPHPGRLLLRHRVGAWEMTLSWSRRPGAGWRKKWSTALTYDGQPHPTFGSFTTYAAAVQGLPGTPPVVVPEPDEQEMPPLVRDRLREAKGSAEDDSWQSWAGRLASRWVVVCGCADGRVIHWNFICKNGEWVYDDLDGFVAWDELGEVTRELVALLRAHRAEAAAGATSPAITGIWKDVQALRSAQPVGSGVETRLRL
ncbi:hypothetical protein AB0940_24785 [Streptomyces sp. NPDC006656]|uniref:hypothetical protein n=1 Tax=Streptomyces sp. NPDC006656 TaxID=3156899 RepID=UPI00345273EE